LIGYVGTGAAIATFIAMTMSHAAPVLVQDSAR
jgi:hypothetical protein